ncbi:MAG: hypothetical protein ACYCYO_22480 [Bacilli bacterium]
MKIRLALVSVSFVLFGITGCGSVTHNIGSTNQSANRIKNTIPNTGQTPPPKANNSTTTQLAIVGTIQSVKINSNNTLVTVKVASIPKVFRSNGHDSVHKGSVISILFSGTTKQFFVGAGSSKKYLPVKVGLNITTVITSQKTNSGTKWTSLFDSYEYKKDGSYLNWKEQNFGANVFG